ncbi:MAG: Calx-beta domain-containing protein, partial [Gaiellaceae bacterium]
MRGVIGVLVALAVLAPGSARAHGGLVEQATLLTQAVTLDGVMQPGEWDDAATFDFTANPDEGKVWTKFDANYVYFAFRRIDLLASLQLYFQVTFDDAHNGVADIGDDGWTLLQQPVGNVTQPSDGYYAGSNTFLTDPADGGTIETEGGIFYTAGTGEAVFELRHPRCSPDIAHDVCFPADGSPVGVTFSYSSESAAISYPAAVFDQANFGDLSLELPPAAPELSIGDASVEEGDSGTTDLVFTVTRTGDLTGTTTVDFQTWDGSASAPVDYESQSGGLVFDPGESEETITVLVNGDTDAELDESLSVYLSNESGGTLVGYYGEGTIEDDDAMPLTLVVSTAAELEDAVSDANANIGPDTIVVNPGLYEIGTTLYVTGDLTIDGVAGSGPVIDGGGYGPIFLPDGSGTDLTLLDLTIQNADQAIYTSNNNGELNLNRVTITGDLSYAIWISSNELTTITNSTFSGNDVAIEHENGELVLRNVTITGSTSDNEAGLANYSTTSAYNTIVAGNAG